MVQGEPFCGRNRAVVLLVITGQQQGLPPCAVACKQQCAGVRQLQSLLQQPQSHRPAHLLTAGSLCLLACAHVQMATKDEYDKVIQETEQAYLKILESSQTLLTVLKRESINIQKKRQATS